MCYCWECSELVVYSATGDTNLTNSCEEHRIYDTTQDNVLGNSTNYDSVCCKYPGTWTEYNGNAMF